MKCAHPASTAVELRNIDLIPSTVKNVAASIEMSAWETMTPARVTYSREYPRATASVILSVCCQRGRSTRENHAGSDPRFTACRIWLWVKGRNGMGPAAAAAAPALAFAAAREAPVVGGAVRRGVA